MEYVVILKIIKILTLMILLMNYIRNVKFINQNYVMNN